MRAERETLPLRYIKVTQTLIGWARWFEYMGLTFTRSGQHSLKIYVAERFRTHLQSSIGGVLTVKWSPWKYPLIRGWRTKLYRVALKHALSVY